MSELKGGLITDASPPVSILADVDLEYLREYICVLEQEWIKLVLALIIPSQTPSRCFVLG